MAVLEGRLTAGVLIVIIAYLQSVYGPLSAIAHTDGVAAAVVASARRVRAMFDTRARGTEPARRARRPGCGPRAGHIRFDEVSFAYDPTRPVLDEVSLRGPPGPVDRRRRAHRGGQDHAREPDPAALRPDGRAGAHRRPRRARVRAREPAAPRRAGAAGVVGLRRGPWPTTSATAASTPTTRRSSRPRGTRTRTTSSRACPTGTRRTSPQSGASLSGGERQRLSIARALLKDAPIVILDEPTSSLDAISEAIVFRAIRRLREGRTTIVIAHRLSTIRDADGILVLDGGRVVASGRHDELLHRSDLYAADVRAPQRRQVARRDRHGGRDHAGGAMRVVFAGIIGRYPFGGVAWCSLMYLLGLRALGHEVFYLEDTGECGYDPDQQHHLRRPRLRPAAHPGHARPSRPR